MLFLFLQSVDFVGKKSLQLIKDTGLKRRLTFLTVKTTDVDPQGNETVWHKNKVTHSKLLLWYRPIKRPISL